VKVGKLEYSLLDYIRTNEVIEERDSDKCTMALKIKAYIHSGYFYSASSTLGRVRWCCLYRMLYMRRPYAEGQCRDGCDMGLIEPSGKVQDQLQSNVLEKLKKVNKMEA